MGRERFCKVCRGWHDVDRPWPHNCYRNDFDQRSDLPGPSVIGDSMEPVQSMLDGRMYDSKSRLRATYRRAGVTEVGNEVAAVTKPPPKPKVDRNAVKASVRKAFSQAGLGA